MKQPDARKHQYISFIKSAFRIVAGGLLMCNWVLAAGLYFIIAETLGILEELV